MLDDPGEVAHWEYLEGVRRTVERGMRTTLHAVSQTMREAFEVSSLLIC